MRHRLPAFGKGPLKKNPRVEGILGNSREDGRKVAKTGAIDLGKNVGRGKDPLNPEKICHLPKRVRGKEVVDRDRKPGGKHEGELSHHELRSGRTDDKDRSGRKLAGNLPGEKNDPSGRLLVGKRTGLTGVSLAPLEKRAAGTGRGDPEEAMKKGAVGHERSARRGGRPEGGPAPGPRKDPQAIRRSTHQSESSGRVILSPMVGMVERVHPIPGSTFRNASMERSSP